MAVPFLPTLVMLVVSIGVGYGMTIAFLLGARLIRDRRRSAGGPTAMGTIARAHARDDHPGHAGGLLLHDRGSLRGGGSGGRGGTGTTTNNLLLNNWFLGVFQIAVVWVALIAQELLLAVYSGLFGKPDADTPAARPAPLDRRTIASGVVRVALLVGGVLWSLAMVAEWTTVSPWTAGAGLWVQWIVQHQLLALLAISAALFPTGTWEVLRATRQRLGAAFSMLLLVAGVTVLWAPPPLPSWGLDGLLNQTLFVMNAPSAWGTISPGSLGGLALAARWALEYSSPRGLCHCRRSRAGRDVRPPPLVNRRSRGESRIASRRLRPRSTGAQSWHRGPNPR